MTAPGGALRDTYGRLHAAYGPQGWWPAETPFEVMVGAVLTQNTSWRNVERALAALRAAGWLDPESITAIPVARLAECIRPAGCPTVKARRLAAYCRWLLDSGGEEALAGVATLVLRRELLGVHGVGPETADAILLYAFGRPVFVIDAYTRRLFRRMGIFRGDESYEALRQAFEQAMGPRPSVLNEYHALIVEHAKRACAARPRCDGCVLRSECAVGRDGAVSGSRAPG